MKSLLCAFACALILGAGVISCSHSNGARTPARATGKAGDIAGDLIDPERLQNDLFQFADIFQASISAATSEVAENSNDRQVRQFAILWRIRVVTSIQSAVLDPDPRFGFLSCWAIVVQVRDSLNQPEVEDQFTGARTYLLPVVKELEDRLLTMGLKYVSQEKIDQARPDLEAYAAQQPLHSRFSADSIFFEPTARMRRSDGINEILEAPMAPFRGLQGVGDTADAIDRVAMVAARIAEIAQDLPTQTRWQTELLLLEVESMSSVQEAQAELKLITDKFAQLVNRVDVLPEDLREQLEIALADSEEAQRELRGLMTDASELIEKTQATIEAASTTAKDLNAAGAAWEKTAAEANALIGQIRVMGEERGDREPFDVNDLTKAAEALTETIEHAQVLLAEAQAPLADESSAREIVRIAERSARKVINQMTIRVVGIVVLAFLLVWVYRVFIRKSGAGA